jgi:hypothetical protein
MSMTQAFISDVQLVHFTALFQSVAPVYAERWVTLLQGKSPAKWRKIQPCRAWPCDVSRNVPARMEWTEMLDQAIVLAQAHKVREAFVLDCYHGSEGVEIVPILQLKARLCLNDQRYAAPTLTEGYVSLLPGKLALATNHEGGCWLIDYTGRRNEN